MILNKKFINYSRLYM